MNNWQSFDIIKQQYPNKWVLLGSPEIKNNQVLGGIVLFHYSDKKTVLEFAKKEIDKHPMIKVMFTGKLSQSMQLNIFKVREIV